MPDANWVIARRRYLAQQAEKKAAEAKKAEAAKKQ